MEIILHVSVNTYLTFLRIFNVRNINCNVFLIFDYHTDMK